MFLLLAVLIVMPAAAMMAFFDSTFSATPFIFGFGLSALLVQVAMDARRKRA